MSAPLPICQNPNCHKEMTLIGEGADHWTWGCYSCGCARVVTKDRDKAAARYKIIQQRKQEAAARHQAHERRTKFFFLR